MIITLQRKTLLMLFHHQHLHQHLLPLSSSSSSSSTPLTTRMPSAHRSTPADVISHSHLELSRSAAIATAKFESRLAGLPLEHTKSRSEADNTRFVYDAFYDSVICEQSVRLYEDDAVSDVLSYLSRLDFSTLFMPSYLTASQLSDSTRLKSDFDGALPLFLSDT